jgi:nitroreductase
MLNFILITIILASHGGEMNIRKVIQERRSIRRYTQDSIPLGTLKKIIDDGRMAPSPVNVQTWEFVVVRDKELVETVFDRLGWLEGEPPENQRPTALILILLEKESSTKWAVIAGAGACCQNMLLSAWSEGVGSCWIGSVRDKDKIKDTLKIPIQFDIFSAITLGYPAEAPILEKFKGKTRPWRDNKGVLHVSKKELKDILHINYYGKH